MLDLLQQQKTRHECVSEQLHRKACRMNDYRSPLKNLQSSVTKTSARSQGRCVAIFLYSLCTQKNVTHYDFDDIQ